MSWFYCCHVSAPYVAVEEFSNLSESCYDEIT
jgi:hypothetical protein